MRRETKDTMHDHKKFDEAHAAGPGEKKEPALRSQNRFWSYLAFIVLILGLLWWLSLTR